MLGDLKKIFNSNLFAVIIGAFLTFYLGGVITNQWADQRASDSREYESAKNKYTERIKFLESFSTDAQKRLYKMKQVYWTTKKVKDIQRYKNYEQRWSSYTIIKNTWNERLFKYYSLSSVLFGEKTKGKIERLHQDMYFIHIRLSVIRLKKEPEVSKYRKEIKSKLDAATARLRSLIEELYNRSLIDKEPNE